MGNLADKANQFEKAIQETAFDGIAEGRDYDVSAKLLEIAKDVWHLSERLEAIEDGKPAPAGSPDSEAPAGSASESAKAHKNVRGPGYYA